MGDYSDFNMIVAGTDQPTAGICHARGGTILKAPQKAGAGVYCVIDDPAGAVCALYEP